jgi:hypothetical protein
VVTEISLNLLQKLWLQMLQMHLLEQQWTVQRLKVAEHLVVTASAKQLVMVTAPAQLILELMMLIPQLVWADVNLIVNKSRHPLISVAGFIFPSAVGNIFKSS